MANHNKNNKINIEFEEELPRFSTPRKKGGSGPHKDKRTKRDRTRQQRKEKLRKRWEDDL